jgi:hypothetical protein
MAKKKKRPARTIDLIGEYNHGRPGPLLEEMSAMREITQMYAREMARDRRFKDANLALVLESLIEIVQLHLASSAKVDPQQ